MIVLQIEHAVQNFEGWKKVFDSDPIGRKNAGVRRYRILQPVSDPNHVIVDLEFDTVKEAEEALSALQKLWAKVEGKVMMDAKSRILDVREAAEL